MKSSILRWSMIGFLTAMLLLPSLTAAASDCPPDDLTFSDCAAAASTARSPLVPIAGAVAGGIVGSIASSVLGQSNAAGAATAEAEADPAAAPEAPAAEEPPVDNEPSDDKEDKKQPPKDPCQEDVDRLHEASFDARNLQAFRQHLQNLLQLYETEYENTRFSSFMSAGVDIAFIGGSIWSKPLSGWMGKTIAEQTLRQKLAEAALKALGKELTKSVFKVLADQGISWGNFLKNPLRGAQKKLIQESLKEAILESEMKKFDALLDALNPIQKNQIRQTVSQSIKKEVAGPLADYYSNLLSLYSMGSGAISGARKLEAIREQMREVREQLIDVEDKLDQAISRMEIARHAIEHCRRIWSQS